MKRILMIPMGPWVSTIIYQTPKVETAQKRIKLMDFWRRGHGKLMSIQSRVERREPGTVWKTIPREWTEQSFNLTRPFKRQLIILITITEGSIMEPQQQPFDPGGKLSVRSWTSKLQLKFYYFQQNNLKQINLIEVKFQQGWDQLPAVVGWC